MGNIDSFKSIYLDTVFDTVHHNRDRDLSSSVTVLTAFVSAGDLSGTDGARDAHT